jgi:hypothetical protein
MIRLAALRGGFFVSKVQTRALWVAERVRQGCGVLGTIDTVARADTMLPRQHRRTKGQRPMRSVRDSNESKLTEVYDRYAIRNMKADRAQRMEDQYAAWQLRQAELLVSA